MPSLAAPLVAAAQVLIYIGAISVLILFAIMLTQSKFGPAKLVFHHQAWAAAVAAVFLFVILSVVVISTAWPRVAGPVVAATQAIAHLLFGDYVLAFEVVSIILLAAVIGGVFLAKRDDAETDAELGVDLTNPPAIPPLPILPPVLVAPHSLPASNASNVSPAKTAPPLAGTPNRTAAMGGPAEKP